MTRFDRLIHAALVLGFIALCAGISSYAHAQSLTFTLETSTTDGKSVIPRLTWQTTPAAGSCTASGASDWTGTKPATGTVILAAVTATRTYSLVCNWPGVTTATVKWTAPTTNTDGSALTNLAGYRIQYGTSATNLSQSASVTDPSAKEWTSPNLAAGTWFFGVRAVNAQGLESDLSNVASKTLTAAAQQSRSLELTIRFPNPPVITLE